MNKSELFPKDDIGGISAPKECCTQGDGRKKRHIGQGVKQGDAIPQFLGNELCNGGYFFPKKQGDKNKGTQENALNCVDFKIGLC